jgi:hypothetical protein
LNSWRFHAEIHSIASCPRKKAPADATRFAWGNRCSLTDPRRFASDAFKDLGARSAAHVGKGWVYGDPTCRYVFMRTPEGVALNGVDLQSVERRSRYFCESS